MVTVAAENERSQLMNREAARARLASLLRDSIAPPPPPRVATRPTRGARERRLDAKRRRAQVKRNRRYESRRPVRYAGSLAAIAVQARLAPSRYSAAGSRSCRIVISVVAPLPRRVTVT